MNKLLTLVLLMCYAISSYSKEGDVTKIQTFNWGNDSTARWFNFPTNTDKFREISIDYKIRCFPGRPCGEWDYIANIYVQQWYSPSFRVDSNKVDSLSYSKTETYTYAIKYDSLLKRNKIDSTLNKAKLVQFYLNENNFDEITRTINVYPVNKRYFYKNENFEIDSNFIKSDSTIYMQKRRVYENRQPFFAESFEIFRYITPYGNGLNLGPDGWTFKMDVTDFEPLLQGKVFLYSSLLSINRYQEDLDLVFNFVEGEKKRKIKTFKKIYDGGPTYDANFEKVIKGEKLLFNDDEARLVIIQSGHGFGGNNDNCAEFCDKKGYLKVNGKLTDSVNVWRECGSIPMYPQGGTWLIDRTNWCPGMEVNPYNWEIGKYLKKGEVNEVDWDMEFYNKPWQYGSGGNERPYYVITGYLITYETNRKDNDLEVIDILSPSNSKFHQRYNPSCNNPWVRVRNNGKNPVSNFTIEYGIEGNSSLVNNYNSGTMSIGINEVKDIILPELDLSKANGKFYAKVTSANGVQPAVNYLPITSNFDKVPNIGSEVRLELRTNNFGLFQSQSPYRYNIVKTDGETEKVIFDRPQTEDSKTYIDSLYLEDGCYRLELENQLGYGLYFWFLNRQNSAFTAGSMQLSYAGNNLFKLNNDFGNKATVNFKVVPQPKMTINSNEIDFGLVKMGDSITKELILSSIGNEDLTISKLNLPLGSSNGFFIESTTPTLDPNNGIVIPKKTGQLVIKLKYKAIKTGVRTANLVITSNDPLNLGASIRLRGSGDDGSGVEVITKHDIVANIIDNKIEIIDKSGLLSFTNYNYSIVDILGKEIKKGNNHYKNSIELESLIDSKVLMLRIESEGKVYMVKLVN